MRLSPKNARRLTVLVWRERLRRWLLAGASVLALAGLLGALFVYRLGHVDRTVEVRDHNGVVIGPETVGIGRRASLLRVHLDDGRDVDAFDAFRVVPPHGAQVIITEERHASGHLTYKVLRALDH
jgi:hypothetical protein